MHAVAVDKSDLYVSCENGTWHERKVYYLVRVGVLKFVSPIMNHNGLFVEYESISTLRQYGINEIDELAEIKF